MLFPALRFKKESLGRDFCVCEGGGWGRGCMGESVMAFRVKNYEILGVLI